MKFICVLFFLVTLSSCMLVDFDRDASNWQQFEARVGIMHSLDESMDICINSWSYRNAPEKLGRNPLVPAGGCYRGVDDVIVIRQGAKIIVDKIYYLYRGGYESYVAVGRVFQDGQTISFRFYLGMEGHGEMEFPPMTPIPINK